MHGKMENQPSAPKNAMPQEQLIKVGLDDFQSHIQSPERHTGHALPVTLGLIRPIQESRDKQQISQLRRFSFKYCPLNIQGNN